MRIQLTGILIKSVVEEDHRSGFFCIKVANLFKPMLEAKTPKDDFDSLKWTLLKLNVYLINENNIKLKILIY